MANSNRTVRSIHSRSHMDLAHDPSRKGDRTALARALDPTHPMNAEFAPASGPWPVEGFQEPVKFRAHPDTVLGDTSEGIPGEHRVAERAKVDDWQSMAQDDFHLEDNSGSAYDEAFGPRDLVRRPAESEWEPHDIVDVWNRRNGRD